MHADILAGNDIENVTAELILATWVNMDILLPSEMQPEAGELNWAVELLLIPNQNKPGKSVTVVFAVMDLRPVELVLAEPITAIRLLGCNSEFGNES